MHSKHFTENFDYTVNANGSFYYRDILRTLSAPTALYYSNWIDCNVKQSMVWRAFRIIWEALKFTGQNTCFVMVHLSNISVVEENPV